MVRRLVAAGVGIAIVIVLALVINGCVKSEKRQSLTNYNRDVNQLMQESDTQVSHPLFVALTNSTSKSALDIEQQIDDLRKQAQSIAARAGGLSVPGEMANAQRDLLLALDLRVEGMAKVAGLVPKALGGQAKQASVKIAGAMETFLASDVVYSQRVVPLIQQTLTSGGIQGLVTNPSRSLPNIGWLEPADTLSRISGQSTSSSGAATGIAPGTHGSALLGVSVGANELQPEPTLNHINSGANPTFTAIVEDSGENKETDVKVDITVTAAGKQYKASHVIDQAQPGTKYNVEVTVVGVPQGEAAKVEAYVEPVPGETDVENNKTTYLAIFGE
jgi:hypothetical protein